VFFQLRKFFSVLGFISADETTGLIRSPINGQRQDAYRYLSLSLFFRPFNVTKDDDLDRSPT
jgi:hypothetical protein